MLRCRFFLPHGDHSPQTLLDADNILSVRTQQFAEEIQAVEVFLTDLLPFAVDELENPH